MKKYVASKSLSIAENEYYMSPYSIRVDKALLDANKSEVKLWRLLVACLLQLGLRYIPK
jgi:hypothetical protein